VKTLKTLLAIAVVLYLGLVAFFFFDQRNLMYFPTRTYTPLADAGANRAFEEITVRTEDGIDLKAWYAPATSKPCTIVFFHGNGDNLRTAAPIADPYIAAGYGFLLAEYRGYSGLPGKPTENGLFRDARADVRELMARGIADKRIILFGHSLGTGVAVQMGTEIHAGGVMLLAPFLSIPKAAQVHYPFLPASLLVLDRFDSEKKIAAVREPVVIVNGTQDAVIPPAQGQELFALANEPKEFHSFPGLGHDNLFDSFAPLGLDWLQTVCPSK
jgi:uncharacterized protein